jgi:hypothetical protein
LPASKAARRVGSADEGRAEEGQMAIDTRISRGVEGAV